MNHLILMAGATVTLALLAARPLAAADLAAPPSACDRSCLYAIADRYLESLESHDTSSAAVTRHVKHTENGVRINVGDGLGNTINGRRGYNLRVADPSRGQVAVFDVIEEQGVSALLATRFRIANRQIVEVETVLSRQIDDSPLSVIGGMASPNPLWSTPSDPALRLPREQLINITNNYFNTLQQNNGTLHTRFAEDCNRIENGLLITNNPLASGNDIASKGCREQLELGHYVYHDRVRDRRYPLVDEEMGVVLAGGFMDHTGKTVNFEWTDGTPQKSNLLYPQSSLYLELFKIENSEIRLMESVSATVPYNMPSVW